MAPAQLPERYLSWAGIFRLGLVQTSLGAIVVLTTSTMNRVMVIEHMLPAMIPGALVALHYFVQLSRPQLGHASDVRGRRTPWIIGGIATLAIGAVLASLATAWMGTEPTYGILLAVLAFVLIGIGVGASGTSLLALLAKRVAPERRPAAGSIVWMMMICGFVLTAGIAGALLDPFTTGKLVQITGSVAAIAVIVTILAVWGVEGSGTAAPAVVTAPTSVSFRLALKEVWADDAARHFTVFVFLSMLAYSTQDLILEPFAGAVFGMTPGESTQLSGVQNGGVLAGMLLIALCGSLFAGRLLGSLRFWIVTGCAGSACALGALTVAGFVGPSWPLHTSVFLLGLANGAFAVAAIGCMMALAGAGAANREGVRMGLWGAAQAIAFAIGGFLGTLALDVLRWLLTVPDHAYAFVFAGEALLFVAAARMAVDIQEPSTRSSDSSLELEGSTTGWRYTS
jgi:BCD family chlorophyll transporter-like MFS transporter